jgi:hypothetical protein
MIKMNQIFFKKTYIEAQTIIEILQTTSRLWVVHALTSDVGSHKSYSLPNFTSPPLAPMYPSCLGLLPAVTPAPSAYRLNTDDSADPSSLASRARGWRIPR